MRHVTDRARSQQGMSLIEVLCAVLILSIGMVAGVGMQLTAMRSNQDALYRSNALILAEDMAARLRANRPGLDSGAYIGADTDAGPTSPGCLSSGCSPAGLAAEDLAAWTLALQPASLKLPPRPDASAARGRISADGDGVYTILLEWGTTLDGNPLDDALVLRTRP